MTHSPAFTLIELLVVLAIVGVIAATAVPQYAVYKQKAFDTRALSDLHNAALAEEAYFIEHEEYLACADRACSQLPGLAALSAGVRLTVELAGTGFLAQSSHPRGTGRTFVWDSERGGLVEQGAQEGSNG